MHKYIGPKEFLKQINPEKIGKIIHAENDIKDWIIEADQKPDENNEIIATFIVDLESNLRINDRHSEHVVCANGKNVLSAGEITFNLAENNISVSQITNQSTGYCPSPKTWSSVFTALKKTGLEFPDYWTKEFVFRICSNCKNLNLIKDNFFVCTFCERDLPEDE